MQVLEPAAQVSIGTLYILDDGNDVAIVRLQGEPPDLWIVNRLSCDGGMRRCAMARRRWLPRAVLTVQWTTLPRPLSPSQKLERFFAAQVVSTK
jgi:hypothetical protein